MRSKWIAAIPALVFVLTAVPASAQVRLDGERLYRKHCASCHGDSGRGDGPDAALFAEPPRDLRAAFLKKYSVDDLVQRIRSGRALELLFDLPKLRERAADVESLFAHLQRLPKLEWQVVEHGRESFENRCAQCHGASGQPPAKLPRGVRRPVDLSTPAYQRALSDAQLAELVRHGLHGMPALTPRVAADDVRALVAFVRVLSPGFIIYDRYCAVCHGDDGQGVGSFAEAVPLPALAFDSAYFARRDPEEIRAALWHMVAQQKATMPHYHWVIDEATARAIVEYLRLPVK